MGYGAGYNISGGNANVMIGYNVTNFGVHNRTINNCVLIGDFSGVGCDSDNNTLIGANSNSNGGVTNSLALGNSALVTTSNTFIFGTASIVATGINGGTPTLGTDAIKVGNANTNGNGASLTVGGTWTNASSINFKEDFQPLDAKDILTKIENLNISRWRYKGTGEYHIGPIAEEFYQAFKTGNDAQHISTIDPSGISLIAITELSRQLKEKEKELEETRKEIADLKARLNKLELKK
jgi:hypothetical protein